MSSSLQCSHRRDSRRYEGGRGGESKLNVTMTLFGQKLFGDAPLNIISSDVKRTARLLVSEEEHESDDEPVATSQGGYFCLL